MHGGGDERRAPPAGPRGKAVTYRYSFVSRCARARKMGPVLPKPRRTLEGEKERKRATTRAWRGAAGGGGGGGDEDRS